MAKEKGEHVQITVVQIKCWDTGERKISHASQSCDPGREGTLHHEGDSSRGWKAVTRSPAEQEGGRGDGRSPHPHPSALKWGCFCLLLREFNAGKVSFEK